jgi:hypothetical protein
LTDKHLPSRRGFLRSAVISAMLAPAMVGFGQTAVSDERETVTSGPDAMVLGLIALDREVADQEGVLNGTLSFLRAASGPVVVRWMDSFGRVAGEQKLSLTGKNSVAASFSFNMRAGLTYVNWIRVTVNGVPQVATAKFMLSPAHAPWDDYHTISWAHYPDGFYDQLRSAGLDAIIAYTKESKEPVLDNNFKFYVEQMAWEVYAIYHKDQPEWRALLTKASMDRENMELWVRTPCLNDPETAEYLRENLTHYVREHRPFRPLFYNIADELGQGDQIQPNDFCHSKYCTAKFAGFLQREHGLPSGVAREWSVGELTHWDNAHFHAVAPWDKTESMIAHTTTDRAFEAIALAYIRQRYKTIGQFNQEWGTGFSVPKGNRVPTGEQLGAWQPILGVARESLSVPNLDEASLEKAMGPLDQANARWGSLSGRGNQNEPTKFQNWGQVAAFIRRFYKEVGEIDSTRGWNVSAWCDFRNFMDETFADSVKRASDICKAEDRDALCGTEGAQVPFAYGWYNYEQVVRAVDVIEVYNRGNNVEVIRSLKPSVIMFSTHRFSVLPGQLQDSKQRLRQQWAIRPIWWGVFHNHNAALVWDANEVENRFVDPSTGKTTASAAAFSDLFHELRAGIGKLIINSQRQQDGIAIHYSQASIQIHWFLDNLKNAREWMLKSGGRSDSLCSAVRNSWTKLIEDLALQYNFVGKNLIESGGLSSGEYKVFIMPQSIAVSAEEAAQIRAFVQAGGTLIADYRAADLNGRGRDLGKGQLDDVFGISHGPARNLSKSIEGVGNLGALHLEGKELHGMTAGDATVIADSGKALARSGDVPLVILNQFGSGRAIFLNMEIADYAYLRLKPGSRSSLPEIIESALEMAEIKPQVRVLGADGKRLPGAEIVRYANGNCEHVAIFRNPQFDNAGWDVYPKLLADRFEPIVNSALIDDVEDAIDNSLFEKEDAITIEWTEEHQTYDVRGRKDLGNGRTLKATLNPWEPLVYTRSPQPLSTLRVAVSPDARAGEMVEFIMTDNGSAPAGSFRVVHLEFRTPSGELYDLYTRNTLIKTTPHIERVPFAVNDPKGNWKVIGHDLMTGQEVESSFELQ